MKIANTEFRGIFKSKGGLFDVTNKEMEANIGKSVTYINPTCGVQRQNDLVIEGIQKDYKGETIYRLTYPTDTFGMPANPNEITINH